jgi:hypothetical protein
MAPIVTTMMIARASVIPDSSSTNVRIGLTVPVPQIYHACKLLRTSTAYALIHRDKQPYLNPVYAGFAGRGGAVAIKVREPQALDIFGNRLKVRAGAGILAFQSCTVKLVSDIFAVRRCRAGILDDPISIKVVSEPDLVGVPRVEQMCVRRRSPR